VNERFERPLRRRAERATGACGGSSDADGRRVGGCSTAPRSVDLRALLRRTGDGALAIGLDGRIAFWNDAATALLGHHPLDVMGRACWTVLAGRDLRGAVLCREDCAVMKQAGAGDATAPLEMRARAMSGRPIDLSVSTLSADTGDPGGLVIVHLLRHADPHDRAEMSAGPEGVPLPRLTRRELEVLTLIRDGASTRDIAERLRVSPTTVRNHTQSILGKLGAHSRLQAVVLATRRRLLR
jgi:PAS domain S-box-containing protein